MGIIQRLLLRRQLAKARKDHSRFVKSSKLLAQDAEQRRAKIAKSVQTKEELKKQKKSQRTLQEIGTLSRAATQHKRDLKVIERNTREFDEAARETKSRIEELEKLHNTK